MRAFKTIAVLAVLVSVVAASEEINDVVLSVAQDHLAAAERELASAHGRDAVTVAEREVDIWRGEVATIRQAPAALAEWHQTADRLMAENGAAETARLARLEQLLHDHPSSRIRDAIRHRLLVTGRTGMTPDDVLLSWDHLAVCERAEFVTAQGHFQTWAMCPGVQASRCSTTCRPYHLAFLNGRLEQVYR
jgi:hypothetical protein